MTDLKTIVLTTDFSDTSMKAFPLASLLARKFGAKIVLTFVGDLFPPLIEEYYVAINLDEIKRVGLERAEKQLAEFAKKNLGSDVAVEQQVLLGVPHVEIVNLARDRQTDLIVMATHGRGFISHAVLGSTTERVVRQAPCPVLVVRDPQAS